MAIVNKGVVLAENLGTGFKANESTKKVNLDLTEYADNKTVFFTGNKLSVTKPTCTYLVVGTGAGTVTANNVFASIPLDFGYTCANVSFGTGTNTEIDANVALAGFPDEFANRDNSIYSGSSGKTNHVVLIETVIGGRVITQKATRIVKGKAVVATRTLDTGEQLHLKTDADYLQKFRTDSRWSSWAVDVSTSDNSAISDLEAVVTTLSESFPRSKTDSSKLQLLSTTSGNLLQLYPDGLYYGITAPANVNNLYVDVENGVDQDPNNVSGAGSRSNPLKTVMYALRLKPTNTKSNIYLKEGQEHVIDNAYLQTANKNIDFYAFGDEGDKLKTYPVGARNNGLEETVNIAEARATLVFKIPTNNLFGVDNLSLQAWMVKGNFSFTRINMRIDTSQLPIDYRRSLQSSIFNDGSFEFRGCVLEMHPKVDWCGAYRVNSTYKFFGTWCEYESLMSGNSYTGAFLVRGYNDSLTTILMGRDVDNSTQCSNSLSESITISGGSGSNAWSYPAVPHNTPEIYAKLLTNVRRVPPKNNAVSFYTLGLTN